MADDLQHPDPSSLTTQQLWREIGALKELVFFRIAAIEASITIAHDDLVRVPTDVQKQVGNLKELVEEKFHNIEKRFDENAIAVAAALQAQKELVTQQNISAALSAAKQEASFSKQIDALGLLIETKAKASDDKIDDVKERMTRLEGKGEGAAVENTTHQISSNYVLAIIGACVGVALLLIAIWKLKP